MGQKGKCGFEQGEIYHNLIMSIIKNRERIVFGCGGGAGWTDAGSPLGRLALAPISMTPTNTDFFANRNRNAWGAQRTREAWCSGKSKKSLFTRWTRDW